MLKRLGRFLVLVALVLLALSGCSADADGSHGSADEPEQAELGSATADVPGELAATVKPLGATLRLGLVRPASYHPHEVVLTDQSAVILADLLYDGLTEAVGTDGELRAGLASSWEPDETFQRWRFELDPATGVTADDVVESLEPLTGDGSERLGVSTVLAADLMSIKADGAEAVIIELAAPNAGLPWVLSGVPYSIVGADGGSTGDYELTSDDTNGMILARRGEQDNRAPVNPSRILVTWADTPTNAAALLESGRVDVAVSPLGGDGEVNAFVDRSVVTTSAIRFYVFNSDSEALDDPEVRRSVLTAVDRAALLEVQADQEVVAVDGLLGPAMSGYFADACGTVCRYVPTASVDGGAGGGPGLQIAFAGDEQRAIAAVMAEQLSEAGFDAEPGELAPDDLARAVVQGDTDVFAFGWVASATSGDAVLPPLLSVDSPANVARIASPVVDELLDRAAMTADDRTRWGLLNDAHRTALSEAVILPVAGSTSVLAISVDASALVVRADGSLDLDSSE